MTAVLFGLEPSSDRCIYLADSFKGLPKDTDVSEWKLASTDSNILGGTKKSSLHGHVGQFNISRKIFETNMDSNGFNVTVFQNRIKVLEGFYAETLPQLKSMNVKLSFLRLDGDIYISTMQALQNSYELVQPGGYIYVDDYGSFEGCKRAVDVFKQSVGDNAPLFPIFEDNNSPNFEAVWWRKPIVTKGKQNELGPELSIQYMKESSPNCVRIIFILVAVNALFLWAFFCKKRNHRDGRAHQ